MKLIDARAKSLLHPETFLVPPEDILTAIDIGWCVKLGFECLSGDIGGERVWVEVIDVLETGKHWTGAIVNEPLTDIGIDYRDFVNFDARHVHALLSPDEMDELVGNCWGEVGE